MSSGNKNIVYVLGTTLFIIERRNYLPVMLSPSWNATGLDKFNDCTPWH